MKTKWKITCLVLALMSLVLLFSSCGRSSSSSSSGSYRYGTRESYDAKYGAGSYDADTQLLNEMRNSWGH